MKRNQIVAVLRNLLAEETGEQYDQLDESASLREELELDSVDMISLVLKVENELGVEIKSQDLDGVETVGALLDLLESRCQSPDSKAA